MGATNCPETPRQKMITMMYLVYTAMLALNVSAEVVNGFKSVGTAMHETNKNLVLKLDDTYANFDQAMENSPDKVREMYNRAQEIRRLSQDITAYIDSQQYLFIGSITGKAEIEDYSTGEKTKRVFLLRDPNDETKIYQDSVKAALDFGGYSWFTDKQLEDNHKPSNFFLGEAGVVHEDHSAYLIKQKILNFKERINSVLGEDSSHVKVALDMSDGYDKDGNTKSWELLNFDEVISGAALVTLTRLKAEIMNAEFDAVNMLYKKVSKGDYSFDQVALISRPKSTYILQGGVFETTINVGAYDSRQKFTANVNGQTIASNEDGGVVYKTVCNSLGRQVVRVRATLSSPDGGTKEYTTEDEYFVAKPAGVVRLDCLQVVYAGLDNPITISAAGIDTRNLKATIDGQGTLTKGEGDGSYVLKPSPGQKTLTINVDATIDNKTTRVGTQKVIVKDIPAPIISVAGVANGGRISKKDISDGTPVIPAKNPDFLLKIDNRLIRIQSMVVAVGAKEEPCQGPRITAAAASIVKKATRGEKLTILAKVMMPDGKTKDVTYTATIK